MLAIATDWEQLPNDLAGIEERIVAFLQLADGEEWDFRTLCEQCGEGKITPTRDAIRQAIWKQLIIETVPHQSWKAVLS